MKTPTLHNHEAERMLLSLLAHVSLANVADTRSMVDGCPVSASDFHLPAHARQFEAAMALLSQDLPVEVPALATALRGHPEGAPGLLMQAFGEAAARVPAQWPGYAREVRQLALRRRLLARAQEAAHAAVDFAQAPEEVALTTSGALAALASSGGQGLRTMQEDVAKLIDEVADVCAGKKAVCLRTGVEIWDELIGGLFPGKLHVVGAQPGVGKSALVGRFILNLAASGVRCGLASLEDPAVWLAKRGVSNASGVPVKVLSTQRLNEWQMERFGDAVMGADAWARNVVRDERSSLTAQQVAASLRQMVVQYGCRAVFVDHLGELDVQPGQHHRHDLAVHEAVKLLRDVGKDLDVPVVLVAHFHRPKGSDAEPRFQRPTSGMWANSGGVEKMARVAVGLWLQQGVPDEIVCSVLKQNEGSKDFDFTVKLHLPSGLVDGKGGRKREGEAGHHEEVRP